MCFEPLFADLPRIEQDFPALFLCGRCAAPDLEFVPWFWIAEFISCIYILCVCVFIVRACVHLHIWICALVLDSWAYVVYTYILCVCNISMCTFAHLNLCLGFGYLSLCRVDVSSNVVHAIAYIDMLMHTCLYYVHVIYMCIYVYVVWKCCICIDM